MIASTSLIHPGRRNCPSMEITLLKSAYRRSYYLRTMKTLLTLTSAQLKRAAAIKDEITSLESELGAILGAPTTVAKPMKKKRGMSAAGRARVAAAQKARWAKIRAAKKA